MEEMEVKFSKKLKTFAVFFGNFFREEAFHGIGGEQTFLDISALFTRSVNSWFSPFSGIQKRDQGAGCLEAAALKNSKK